MLGFYENFPSSIQYVTHFSSVLSSKQLQEKIIKVCCEVNRKEFSFEEVANPTIPKGIVIFEFGIADAGGFSYIDEEEIKKALNLLAKEYLHTLDFFCAIRYYKGKPEKKKALKFDYYLMRTVYDKNVIEMQVHHERGPRYVAPEDLTLFIFNKINYSTKRKTLKKTTF